MLPHRYLTIWVSISPLLIACGHPAKDAIPGNTGSVGGTQGSGASGGVPVSAGGAAVGSGGMVTGSGAGPTSGTGGTGNAGGTGGTDVVLPPEGGTGNVVTKMACLDDANQQQALPYTPGYVISDSAKQQATQAVTSMSLKQKADQLRGPSTNIGDYADIFRTPDVGAVKGFQFRDGPRGVNLDAVKAVGTQGASTVFPVPIARGAAFDVDLEYQIGQAMGDEMIASGSTMLLAPTVNILRHPAWGRAQETYGEDSFLLGRIGSAFTVGVQEYVPACVKHYAANNVEKGRETQIAQMDEQTLQEVYARHFGMIIKDAGVSCVMAAYNLVQVDTGQAQKCTQNKHLLTDVLRTGFGFKGFVLSDWWAMPGGQKPAENDKANNASTALGAGMEMELPWNLNFALLETLPGAEAAITAAAQLVVTEKYRFKVNATSGAIGLKTPVTKFNSGNYSITGNDANIALAQKAALEGTVLLKNEMSTLPIKDTVKNVAVIGPTVAWQLKGTSATGSINFATDARLGDLGSSRVNVDPAKAIGPFSGIKAAAPPGVNVVSANGDNAATASAVQAADFLVIVVGLTPQDEGEEYTITPDNADRDANLGLDGKTGGTAQNNFITKYASMATTANKPVVVILEGGSAIDMPWLASVPAVVMAWYPGQSGGAALGQLLFGKANFSGKLPITWPKSKDDEPPFRGSGATTAMGYYLGYRWFDTQKKVPLFPFGHGLSYSTFEYSNVQTPCSTVTAKGVVNVSVDVKNTGTVVGDEIVFAFVSFPGSAVAKRTADYKELKGFKRVSLEPGVAKRVTIPIRVSDLSYYDVAGKAWKVEPGMVKVAVGPSAAADKLTLSDTFTVQ